MKQLPKAVIFDWDNTIIDTWPLIHLSINETMNSMDKDPWDLSKVKENVHKSMRESFPQIFGDKWEEAGKIYRDSYCNNHLNEIATLKDSLNLIDRLNELDIKLFIISNKLGNTLRKEAKHLQIDNKFISIIGSQDAIYDKPSKEVVYLALEGTNLDPKNDLIWFIGDSYVDVECAINSNCQPILMLFNKNNQLSSDLKIRINEVPDKPLLTFNSHLEIINYLKDIKSEKLKTYHLIIKGKVQGVGYRNWMLNEAKKINIKGWVKNLANSDVEAVIEGTENNLEKITINCYQGPNFSKVLKIKKRVIENNNFNDFRIV